LRLIIVHIVARVDARIGASFRLDFFPNKVTEPVSNAVKWRQITRRIEGYILIIQVIHLFVRKIQKPGSMAGDRGG
jgi:hypothetical protein